MATIKDVAKLAGVSVSTASVALRGKGPVSEATRRRVIEAARALDYQPNAIARSLVTRRTRTVGLLLSDLTDPYFHEIAKGVEAVLSRAGYALILADTDRSPEKELRAYEIFRSQQVAGMILAGSGTEDEAHFEQLERRDVPIVTLGRHRSGLPCVAVDNVQAAKTAAQHLIETGCRRIGLIAGPPGLLAAEERREGYLAALAEHGLSPDPRWMLVGDFTPAGGYRAAMELFTARGLDRHDRPDGLVAGNDQMAIGALKALRELGIRVPEEIAVVGIGGIPTGEYVEPPLTTVALPLKTMGEAAAKMLICRVERGGGGPLDQHEEHIWMETTLLVRSSTRPRSAR